MNKPVILVAEDDSLYAKVYQNKLSKEGYEVVIAGNGKEAVEKAEQLKPKLILMDLIMPVMDGFSALKKLKENQKTKGIKVVVMSNLGQDSDIQKAKDLGAEEYFVKANISIQELVEKVKVYLV
ncbi:MAG TPA: response regulator [Candidatus Woesebacteria bacterium]|nr:response regulator [Candidatus Woesebacteria bacterium]